LSERGPDAAIVGFIRACSARLVVRGAAARFLQSAAAMKEYQATFLQRLRVTASALAAASFVTPACSADDGRTQPNAEVLYTEYGIAHVRANDYERLGFAHGYAQARDNACAIELGMLGLDGELSKYFGPDAPSHSLAGASDSLHSDLYFGGLKARGVVERLLAEDAPIGPRAEVRELVRGFVRGFNRWLDEGPAIECIQAEWLRPMTELDVYRKVYAVTTYLGLAIAADPIVNATPPAVSSAEPPSLPTFAAASRRLADRIGHPGSNAVALGRGVTATGRGMNVANPHLKWDGDLHWWQTQLTIPGELDVSGVGLTGMPLIVMGHTQSVAWSITTAEKTQHFTLFELQLAQGSPTTYLVDGQPEAMLRHDVQVEVKRPDGRLEIVGQPQWWTRYGPVLGPEFGLPWTAGDGERGGTAFAFGDPNATNLRMLDTLFALDRARDVADVLDAIRDTQGVPWWTIIAADAEGDVLFSQNQVVANVTDEHLEKCLTPIGRAALQSGGRIILDGSRSDCAWQTDDDALEPGIFGPGTLDQPRMPTQLGGRYVANSNASHWLTSANDRITGMPRIIGDEGSERPLRTRDTITELEQQLAAGPVTREALQSIVLSNRSLAAELAVDDTVRMCASEPEGRAISSAGSAVDVREACSVLASWDRRMDVESRGALLFDRYWRRASDLAASEGRELWTIPFDPAEPIATPAGLDIDGGVFSRALADATLELGTGGISLAAALGEHQYIERGGARIPLGGGGGPDGSLGVFNILDGRWDPERGYTGPMEGSTYMHVVSFDGTPCPDAVTLLTYSQSQDPTSPHHADQTRLYSDKRWVPGRFCLDDVLASPALERLRLPD
jgi:acyl-homoserine-lactone acylase